MLAEQAPGRGSPSRRRRADGARPGCRGGAAGRRRPDHRWPGRRSGATAPRSGRRSRPAPRRPRATRTSGGSTPASRRSKRRAELGPDRRRQVDVGHLAGGVHAGVGAPGDGQRDRRHAQDRRQRVLEDALDGALAGLQRPSRRSRCRRRRCRAGRERARRPPMGGPGSFVMVDASSGVGLLRRRRRRRRRVVVGTRRRHRLVGVVARSASSASIASSIASSVGVVDRVVRRLVGVVVGVVVGRLRGNRGRRRRLGRVAPRPARPCVRGRPCAGRTWCPAPARPRRRPPAPSVRASTSSISAIGALSPLRGSTLMMRV